MKLSKLFLCFYLINLLIGCASVKKTVSVGAISGATIGAISGGAFGKQKGRDTFKNAAIAGLIGAAASYLIHGELKKRDKKIRKETLFNLDQHGIMPASVGAGINVDSITFPVDSEEFIPTHRKGNKVIEQHRIWNISDNASWKEKK